jgi:hypothetical protein
MDDGERGPGHPYVLFLDDAAAQAACTRKNILLINVCRLFYNQSPLLRPFRR